MRLTSDRSKLTESSFASKITLNFDHFPPLEMKGRKPKVVQPGCVTLGC